MYHCRATHAHHRVMFLFNRAPTTDLYTLSLHDALPISTLLQRTHPAARLQALDVTGVLPQEQGGDRKSTRLNSSHGYISYAGFCSKKKILPPREAEHLIDFAKVHRLCGNGDCTLPGHRT